MKIKISILDDNGDSYVGEIELNKNKIVKKSITTPPKKRKIRKDTTGDKISQLISDGYFDTNRTISDIVEGLKTYDYHFKSTSLTSPLRVLVRKKALKKTKNLSDGSKSARWTYVKG